MASSIKAVLRKKKNQDGTYPIAIRVTIDRKTTYIYTGYSAHESEWDATNQVVKKKYPNSERLNNLIQQKKANAAKEVIAAQSQSNSVTLSSVRKQLKPQAGSTFFAQADLFIANMRAAGKYNRVKPEQSRLDSFKTFLKGQDIAFGEITVPLLNRYKAWLKGARKVSERTIANNLLIIRTIYNQAIKAKVIDDKLYPFGKEKVPIKFPDSAKVGLTPSEVKALEGLDLSNEPYLNHARNLWLFSFYFAGVRVSDVLRMKWTDFQDGRLHYTMGKNLKTGSLKVPTQALAIIAQYQKDQTKHDLIFPELKVVEDITDTYNVQRKISFAVKRLNTALAKIAERINLQKSLTMHISRHTFGSLSGEKIPVQMLQKLYRHSSITTTIGYQSNFFNKTADDALDAVLQLE